MSDKNAVSGWSQDTEEGVSPSGNRRKKSGVHLTLRPLTSSTVGRGMGSLLQQKLQLSEHWRSKSAISGHHHVSSDVRSARASRRNSTRGKSMVEGNGGFGQDGEGSIWTNFIRAFACGHVPSTHRVPSLPQIASIQSQYGNATLTTTWHD